MKKLIHCDIETVGGFNPQARTIWSCAFIVTDSSGRELSREAYLISEAMPLLAGDTFWSKRKNAMLCAALHNYKTVTAGQFHARACELFAECSEFWAFNARFEVGGFTRFTEAFNLPAFTLPPVYDLALWAFDALPFSKYAAWALAQGLYTESGKSLSSKAEHILAWLVADKRLVDVEDHDHLALSDTASQVSMWLAVRKMKKRKPAAGKYLTHFAHPSWRKWLKLDEAAKGNRYAEA